MYGVRRALLWTLWCVIVVVMISPGNLNGVMRQFPSHPSYMWLLSAYTSLPNIVNEVVTGINGIGCLPIVTSMLCHHVSYATDIR